MEKKTPDAVTVHEAINTPKRIMVGQLRALLVVVAIVAVSILGYGAYIFTASPAVIREPAYQHLHFRMQIVVNGTAENFAQAKYQQGYAKDQCKIGIAAQPIHFHDNKDQIVHIHWDNITGGMVLKYYGWNYIGGIHNALGYRFDDLTHIAKVPIHGDVLPKLADSAKLYVYTGNEQKYQLKSTQNFLHQDLEQFLGKKSNLPEHQKTSLLDTVFKKASAHEMADGMTMPVDTHGGDTEQLTRINNLIGNVVIFAQKSAPTDKQIKDRFNLLIPLSDSTCGG